ncbi:MAG: sigma-54 dependent transcriptional regulator [Syntrophobacteraceae bacterium]|jgi:DNA-binding NtrC family response regulator|nr:sigma-54 dependent transcriptional regulator [Syntrophobacteraceae bacterium]
MREDAKILIVDDEPLIRLSLTEWLKEENYLTHAVEDGPGALEAIRKEPWDIMLLDLKMPGMDGVEVLREAKKMAPQITVIMMTAYASVTSSVQAMKEGAYDYIVKPFDVQELTLLLKRIVEHQRLVSENILLRKQLTQQYEYENIVGKSAPMQAVFELIGTVADTNATVLITGETGTGKELVARAIHTNSSRRYSPFIAVSCSALPDTLLESELFGYERGAFTGAERTRKGRFELAHSGTLFLDEIGDINMKTQVKLLRVLQERSFRRLGGSDLIEVDVRLITATNRDLLGMVEQGAFRSDLYYRLNVVNIHLPPLRERREDIPLLAAHFVAKYNLEFNKTFKRVREDALTMMLDYQWAGNVRELENVIERAVVIGQGEEIGPELLPFCRTDVGEGHELETLEAVERRHIERMLSRQQWNIARTARILGIDRTTLHKKIKKYELRDSAQTA